MHVVQNKLINEYQDVCGCNSTERTKSDGANSEFPGAC